MTHKTEQTFNAEVITEASIAIGGLTYLTIYGRHINGYFIALPKKGIAAEQAEPDNIAYNKDKLTEAGLNEGIAQAIAEEIRALCNDRQE